jgi:uncharacterized damage-inducible protein DinB
MVNKDILLDLYKHMEWADASVWTAVLAADDGPSDPKIRGYLYHLHMVQRLFLRAWRDEELQTPFPTFDEAVALMSWGRAYFGEAFEHLGGLRNEQLSEPKLLPWASMVQKLFGRAPEVTTLGETALQVALHSTYHRGQINARLREVGGEPPMVDYIAWLLLGRPAPAWPSIPS